MSDRTRRWLSWAAVAVIAALVFARDPAVESLTAALAPAEATTLATGPSFEAWAAPPAYTGRPTLYLSEVAGDAPLSLPQGTVMPTARRSHAQACRHRTWWALSWGRRSVPEARAEMPATDPVPPDAPQVPPSCGSAPSHGDCLRSVPARSRILP